MKNNCTGTVHVVWVDRGCYSRIALHGYFIVCKDYLHRSFLCTGIFLFARIGISKDGGSP